MAMVYRVNMTDLSVTREQLEGDLRQLGGRALNITDDRGRSACHLSSPLGGKQADPGAGDADGNRSALFGKTLSSAQESLDPDD